jgi:maltooligosyltrehalose trehalohydrolase
MLWQGQEFADNYNLPDSGNARIGLRRDTHWEFFYDEFGSTLVRLYRRLGTLRRTYPALRSRDSFFYYQQSLQGTQIVAYHRHAAATSTTPEQFAMVLLNFGESASITLPFPKAGTWTEMIDADIGTVTLQVPTDGAMISTDVTSHYGHVFVWST